MAFNFKQALIKAQCISMKPRFAASLILIRSHKNEPRNYENPPIDYSNFPKTYIKRESEDIEWKTPNEPNYLPRVIKNKHYHYTLGRPWEQDAKDANRRGVKHPKVWVEPMKDWMMFRGDRVEILVGKDKGKQGVITYIVTQRNWVIVMGLNCEYKWEGKTKDFPGILRKVEKPLLVTTEVSLVDPSDNKPTTVEWRYTEEGERVRVSVRTGRIIPMPLMAQETYDYKSKETYPEQPKDTSSKQVSEITFNPVLKTFEMDIMDQMNIKEERIPAKLFWY